MDLYLIQKCVQNEADSDRESEPDMFAPSEDGDQIALTPPPARLVLVFDEFLIDLVIWIRILMDPY